jgi:hypothetical protein
MAALQTGFELDMEGLDMVFCDFSTATIRGGFAGPQSCGTIDGQTEMIDPPALSRGLFHAQVKPNRMRDRHYPWTALRLSRLVLKFFLS